VIVNEERGAIALTLPPDWGQNGALLSGAAVVTPDSLCRRTTRATPSSFASPVVQARELTQSTDSPQCALS